MTASRWPLPVARRDAASARAALLASSAALFHPTTLWPGPLNPYASSCPTPYAHHWRTLSPAGSAVPLVMPPGGSGAAAASGALRTIDASARLRLGAGALVRAACGGNFRLPASRFQGEGQHRASSATSAEFSPIMPGRRANSAEPLMTADRRPDRSKCVLGRSGRTCYGLNDSCSWPPPPEEDQCDQMTLPPRP